jgi:hypothetical protein
VIALILAAAVFAGVGIPWARHLDDTDAITFRHHIIHTERSGCIECRHLGWDEL